MQLSATARKRRSPLSAKGLLADAHALHAALSDLVRVYQFRDRDKICCYDISVTQCYALEALVERGAMRSQALAEMLMLDKSTTTRVVDALVRKGYAGRSPDDEDGRALSVRVTRTGQTLYEKINRELIAEQAELVRDLDPDVRVAAIAVIQRMAKAAQARFLSGVSVGNASSTTKAGSKPCCG